MAYGWAMGKAGRERPWLLPAIVLLVLLVLAPATSAHVERTSGSFAVEMGWSNEPPLAGLDNSVEVEVADISGARVAVPAGALTVEVAYGSAAKTLPLVPGEDPGRLTAPLVPTRPGTYSFHVSGAIDGRPLDVRATCSEATFECVEDGSSAEFPTRDPSRGELAERLSRESARVEAATDRSESAQRTAVAALALAALAAASALALGMRGRWKSGRP